MNYPSYHSFYSDSEYFKTFYPINIFPLYRIISDKVDRLEYQTSFMFDEFPDKERFYALLEDILHEYHLTELPDNEALQELATILLANEFLHRRIRKQNYQIF